MRCDARIIEIERRKKGSGEPYTAIKMIALNGGIGMGEYNDPSTIKLKTQECGGRVLASVLAREEPEWGGVHCGLEFEYKCERCDNTFFQTLPHDETSLSEVLQSYVDALPPPPPWSPPPRLTAESLAEKMGVLRKKEGK